MDLSDLVAQLRDPVDDIVNPQGSGSRSRPGTGRHVCAPTGIVAFEPAEMTLRCGAGTPLDELHAAVAAAGQELALPAGGTVGGALAVGHSDVLRLGRGAVREVLLQARLVNASGTLLTIGGPTVKNVSGFDLCRLMVGSLGTLAVMGEVLLKTRPRPTCRQWYTSERSPDELLAGLYRPSSMLWDGTRCWICLEGHPQDVDSQATRWQLDAVDGPPDLPSGSRWSVAPHRWREVAGSGQFVMEFGVGVVHHERCVDIDRDPVTPIDPGVRALGDRLRATFDPQRRLNPHVDLYRRAAPTRCS